MLSPRLSGLSTLKILSSHSSKYLLHDEFFDVVLLIGNVGEPILSSLFCGAIVTDCSYLLMVFFNFTLARATGSGSWLPLMLLSWLLLFLWTGMSHMSLFTATVTGDSPDVIISLLPYSLVCRVVDQLSPPISFRHEVFSLSESCMSPSWCCIHPFHLDSCFQLR